MRDSLSRHYKYTMLNRGTWLPSAAMNVVLSDDLYIIKIMRVVYFLNRLVRNEYSYRLTIKNRTMYRTVT